MKRRDRIRKLEEMGCTLTRHGGSHDWYTKRTTKQPQLVPRHNEIHEGLFRAGAVVLAAGVLTLGIGLLRGKG